MNTFNDDNGANIPLDDLMAEMEVAENNAAAASQPNLVSGAKNMAETNPLLDALSKITDETPLPEAAKAEEQPKTCKETALQLVSLGFIVAPSMPCGMTDRNDPSKPAKNPVGAWKDSTKPSYCVCKTAEDVERLWKKYPRANVGVFCGGESGIYCLDIDRKQNQDGFAALREIGHDLEKYIPATIVSRTPSGGWHVYFKCSGLRKIWETQGVLVGVDIRGECSKGGLGGFAVEAPSCYQIPATTEIKHYEWIHSPSEYSIMECPDWLLDLADKATEREKRTNDKKVQDDLPKQEKPAEGPLFDEDSPDFKKAVELLTRMPESISGSDAKSRNQSEVAFLLAVRVCRWNCSLNRSATWKAINAKSAPDAKSWNERCLRADKKTPWPWTREEFDHKFDDVEATPEKVRFLEDAERKEESAPPPDEANGEDSPSISLSPFTNVTIVPTMKDGKVVNLPKPKKINALSAEIFRDYSAWPCNIGGCLFDFHAEKKPKDRIEKLPTTADLFAWIARKGDRLVDWHKSGGCHTKEELFAQLKSEARRYEMISYAPHFPKREDVFYSVPKLPPPDQDHKSFEMFVDFFNPCDDAHRTVMKAFFLTPLWFDAGRDEEFVKPPSRPGFIIDTVDAQASGKSTVVNMCAQLYGSSCIRKSKSTLTDETAVKKSILSEEGRRKRIFLLDNVTGTLKSDFLADLMTSPEVTGLAPYGHGDESRPNDLTFAVTVNGAELDTDLATRFYTVKIHAPDPALLEKSATSELSIWECRIDKYIAANRLQLFADMIDLLERAPYRSRRGSRFPVFDARVLSAASQTDTEFVAAAEVIAEDATSANVDKANGENFSALVESTLAGLEGKPGFLPERLTMLTNSAVLAIMEKEPVFAKWSVNTLRARLLKPNLLPDFSRTFERFQNTDPGGHERGFFYGLHLQGEKKTIEYQVVDYVSGQFVVTRSGTRNRFDK